MVPVSMPANVAAKTAMFELQKLRKLALLPAFLVRWLYRATDCCSLDNIVSYTCRHSFQVNRHAAEAHLDSLEPGLL